MNSAVIFAELDTDLTNNLARATVFAKRPAPPPSQNYDLSVTKSVNKDTVFTGEELFYVLNIENHGPKTAYNVVLRDSLPGYLAPLSYSTNPDSSYLNCIFWHIDSLPAAQTLDFTITARSADALPQSPTTIVNSLFAIAANDTNSTNNRATAQVVVIEYEENCEKSYYFDQNVFRPDTGIPLTIFFAMENPSNVRLELYDITGYNITTLLDAFYDIGLHSYTWNGKKDDGLKVGSGVYIITFRTNTLLCWKKVIIVR